MIPELPRLKVLQTSALILHETPDEQRTRQLVENLKTQGVLRNPPVVMPLVDSRGQFVVLDGANRVSALRVLEIPHLIAQVVQPDDLNIQIRSWNHVVSGMDANQLVDAIRNIEGSELLELSVSMQAMPASHLSVSVSPSNGGFFVSRSRGSLVQKVGHIHNVVKCYQSQGRYDRSVQADLKTIRAVHDDYTALVSFPEFDLETIHALTKQGCLLPAGITRFSVSPRALHLNYPLESLASGLDITSKQDSLNHWIQECQLCKRIRYYAESTFVYDE